MVKKYQTVGKSLNYTSPSGRLWFNEVLVQFKQRPQDNFKK